MKLGDYDFSLSFRIEVRNNDKEETLLHVEDSRHLSDKTLLAIMEDIAEIKTK
tara:strand:- start:158 stop:316 length:159 start_codon:yes stop_codon:yes gene_type:complete